MLKMYIDGEQVVSNNNFQIKEEILSPSSAILNNVYPLSWEEDKDYTSKFYYPKDYSSFILDNYTHIPPEDGITTTIQNGTIQDVNTSKEQEVTQLLGDTKQDGTPTPTTPLDIEVVTGKQTTNIMGKNLFVNLPFTDTKSNITMVNDGKKLKVTGTNSTTYYPSFTFYADGTMTGDVWWPTATKINSSRGFFTTSGIQYVLSLVKQGTFTGPSFTILIGYETSVVSTQIYSTSGDEFIKNISSSDERINFISIGFRENQTLDLEIELQLEKGNTKTSYEYYIGNDYIINLGINKLEGSQDFSGTWENSSAWETATETFNGCVVKKRAGSWSGLCRTFSMKKGQTYTFSIYAKADENRTGGLYIGNDASPAYLSINITTEWQRYYVTFTATTDTNNIRPRLENTTSSTTNYTYIACPQLEEGKLTSYSPYFTPIELCKIGDYQDKIYKSGDTWYLHKEIGKVVLDGSESGWVKYSPLDTTNYCCYYLPLNTLYVDSTGATQLCLSNYFTGVSFNNKGTDTANMWVNKFAKQLTLKIQNTITTIAELKTWLGTHNTEVYYVLATPTDTEITNEELINQLESIKLIDGYNEVSITSGDLPGYLTIHYNFVTEQHIDDIIFSGMVKNTSDISLNPRYPKYCSLEVLDYKTLLSEGDTLDFVIYNKTILEAINMVVDAISDYGFELGNVNILNGNEIIGTYSTDNKTAYDVLQYLADISGAKWNCRRKDEYSMYIDFYDPTLLPKGKPIEYTTEWACENNLVDLTFNYGTRDYRNKQVILSDEVYADIDYNEDKVADSYTRDFILNNPIGTIKEILVNGERASVATDTEKDIGVYADFYYKIGDNIVSSNDSNQPYEFGNVISITYVPIIKGREVVQNDNEINRIADQLSVKGTIARYEDRNDETDTNKLLAIGETYLKYKGEAEITLTLQTKDNDIYDIGQMVYFNAPIEDLAKDYLVKSKEINIIVQDEEPGHIFYTYELSSSFNSERAINWFDNQRSKTEGNIKEGEYISRNIDISARTEIVWFNCYCEEIEDMTGDNIINAPLDAPIIK